MAIMISVQLAIEACIGWSQISEHLFVQHDVTVDHTMLSVVAKLSRLLCSTICDNAY